MFKEKYKVIGLCLELRLTELIWHTLILPYKIINGFEILHSETVPYTSDWLNKLKIAVSLKNAALEKLNKTTRNI
jgi:anhydro-N-acetylmuramic acid kinase